MIFKLQYVLGFVCFFFLILQLREMEISVVILQNVFRTIKLDDFRLYPTVSVQASKSLVSKADFLHQG